MPDQNELAISQVAFWSNRGLVKSSTVKF